MGGSAKWPWLLSLVYVFALGTDSLLSQLPPSLGTCVYLSVLSILEFQQPWVITDRGSATVEVQWAEQKWTFHRSSYKGTPSTLLPVVAKETSLKAARVIAQAPMLPSSYSHATQTPRFASDKHYHQVGALYVCV